jgi:hypothetical protein
MSVRGRWGLIVLLAVWLGLGGARVASAQGEAPFVTASGTLAAAADIVELAVLSTANGAVQLTGTWTGTIQFEATVDGSTWFAVSAAPVAGGAVVTSTPANGAWTIAAPLSQVRLRASAWTSGTATVSLLFTTAGGGGGGGGGGTTSNVAVTSDTPGTAAANSGKAEDATHTSGDTGVAAWGVRRDAAASSTTTDGDYATLNVDANGMLWTTVGTVVSVGGDRDDTAPATLSEGSVGSVRLTTNRAMHAAVTGLVPEISAGTYTRLSSTFNTSGNNQVVAGAANKRIDIHYFDIYCNAANTWKLQSGTTNTPPAMKDTTNFLANQGYVAGPPSATPYFKTRSTATATDNDVTLNLSGTGACVVTLHYVQEP